jgi:hypothetical protein
MNEKGSGDGIIEEFPGGTEEIYEKLESEQPVPG